MSDLKEVGTFRGCTIYKDAEGKLCYKRGDGSYSAKAVNQSTIEWSIGQYLKETHLPVGTRFSEAQLR